MTNKMYSFHNDPYLKEKILDQLRAHYKADEIIKGVYWQKGKGCAVGCTVHSDNHSNYETMLGIPRSIARLEDSIFEGLANELAKEFPIEFIEAIPVGVDLSGVTNEFLILMLKRVKGYTDNKEVLDILDRTIKVLEGGEDETLVDDAADASDACAAAALAAAAGVAATYAAADAAAAAVAVAVAVAGAAVATYAAADAAAAADAKERTQQKEDLLMLLRRAK